MLEVRSWITERRFQLLISNFQLPVLNSLSRDNGGGSGEAYLEQFPFSPQLPGPFAAVSSIALAPALRDSLNF
jgi:hypothetical protein